MQRFADACERIGSTTRKNEKIAILAGYFVGRRVEEAALSAVFLSGRPFPMRDERTLDVGAVLLWRAVSSVAGMSFEGLEVAYRRHGDLGNVAEELLIGRALVGSTLSLEEVRAAFDAIAAVTGPAAKLALLERLLRRATAREAKLLVKIITGELRIGLKESLVEDAIARAFNAPAAAVRRANMLRGDVGEVLGLAAEGRLDEARLVLFHPTGFQLASPAESAEDALERIAEAVIEDKYDGIRAHAHIGEGRVRLFSRTRDDVTRSFPELLPELSGLPEGTILDGEIVAWREGHAMPFSALTRRLGRKVVSAAIQREVPVAFLIFDVMAVDGQLVIDRPLSERRALLDDLLGRAQRVAAAPVMGQLSLFGEGTRVGPEARLVRAPSYVARTAEELDALFELARARGNEGLMVKDPASLYAPGRRGRAWLKVKRALSTLDVVVTAVELGHGKRAGLLSDYSFAVRDGDTLLDVGKAFSGLTDAEIIANTKWFMAHAIGQRGGRMLVEPRMVLEVAFDAVMQSDRHASGYALRFPRILRMRPDKTVEEIDTLEAVREIYAKQHGVKVRGEEEGEAA
ncbi:ATP-dependent DNA ligase [Polyangium aurulentum]|uniref:ATP-dependent DNA ligase n=1 Tax=Polyangium aurulentum TaxID=2567896 RepID=UPI00197F8A98|nr:ATP-dependent DNA ligase [Polyangium aurulentum]UQA59199.1 ATP-dependent DNA ligase [Polyangium aurulentum]